MEDKAPANPTQVIWEFVRKQAPVVLLLCVAIWWFNNQYEKADEKIETLNTYIRTEFKATIDQNTRVMEKVKDQLKERNNEH